MASTPRPRLDNEAASYAGYHAKNDYSHDLGVVVMPVASATPAHRLIRLHGGVGYRTVRWEARRVGAPPTIPAAGDTGGDTLLATHVVPHLPVPDTAGGYDWIVGGEYTFVQNAPRVAGVNAFPAGEHPFQTVQSKIATNIVGSYGRSILSQAQGELTVAVVDRFTEYMTGQSYRGADGVPVWPLTVLPAAASSTHIIGG
jgi:hypothetical protein